jgi:hypothetical protein
MVELIINSDSCHDQLGKKWKVWVAVLVPTSLFLLCLFICFSCKGKLKLRSIVNVHSIAWGGMVGCPNHDNKANQKLTVGNLGWFC